MLVDMFILALLARWVRLSLSYAARVGLNYFLSPRRYEYKDYTRMDDMEMGSPTTEDPKNIPKSKWRLGLGT